MEEQALFHVKQAADVFHVEPLLVKDHL